MWNVSGTTLKLLMTTVVICCREAGAFSQMGPAYCRTHSRRFSEEPLVKKLASLEAEVAAVKARGNVVRFGAVHRPRGPG